MSLRKQKRIRKISEEFSAGIRDLVAFDNISSKRDEELFVLDKIGSKSKRIKITNEINNDKSFVSKHESHLVKKIIKNRNKNTNPLKNHIDRASLTDLWSDNTEESGKCIRNKKLKRDQLVHPGQSYNPSISDHQDALAEAVALEIKRTEFDGLKISETFSNLNRIESITSDDDGNNDDETDTGREGIPKNKKKVTKLTRAQRNKLRLRKEKETKQQKQWLEKNLLKSIDSLPNILSSWEQRDVKIDQERIIKKTRQDLKKQQQLVIPYMNYEEVASIPLTDELLGSMRTLRPKGIVLIDEVIKMKTQGLVGASLSDKKLKKKKQRKKTVHMQMNYYRESC
jgi:hypothetical protein